MMKRIIWLEDKKKNRCKWCIPARNPLAYKGQHQEMDTKPVNISFQQDSISDG